MIPVVILNSRPVVSIDQQSNVIILRGGDGQGQGQSGTATYLTASDGTTWQLEILDNGDGTFSQEFRRIA